MGLKLVFTKKKVQSFFSKESYNINSLHNNGIFGSGKEGAELDKERMNHTIPIVNRYTDYFILRRKKH